ALGSAVLAGGRPQVTLEVRRRTQGHVLTVSVDPATTWRLSDDTLRDLRERLEPLGGALEAGPDRGSFRMRVDLPDGESTS
ncbi:MAG TPA: hypothetical protein VF310_06710, partial [Vicinamibacteria bacterium]